VKKKERELQAKETELRKREQVYNGILWPLGSQYCFMLYVGFLFSLSCPWYNFHTLKWNF